MSDLAEKVTRALDTWVDPEKVRDAIDVVLEEAAMAAESLYDKEPSEDQDYGWNCACSRVAIAIRELKDKP